MLPSRARSCSQLCEGLLCRDQFSSSGIHFRSTPKDLLLPGSRNLLRILICFRIEALDEAVCEPYTLVSGRLQELGFKLLYW